jgi:hypothetical protein
VGKHTEGRIHIEREFNLTVGRRGICTTGSYNNNQRTEETYHENVANAKYIESCWNAFEGILGDPETVLRDLVAATRNLLEDRTTTPQDWAALRAALKPFEGRKEE